MPFSPGDVITQKRRRKNEPDLYGEITRVTNTGYEIRWLANNWSVSWGHSVTEAYWARTKPPA